jgi:glycosyltransferase involved in cell wall biosynthesis
LIRDIDKSLVREIIVVNNNSKDETAARAWEAGATVLDEMEQGYGAACLKGIKYLKSKEVSPDIVVFMDADYSDHPDELIQVIKPVMEQGADLVIGSRALGKRDMGAMLPQQVFGNWLATRLLRLFYGANFTDLGPFRAVKWEKLLLLDLKDRNYGWTVEMQLKAAKQKLRCAEVPVSYRKRIGFSKVSGTLSGTLAAGYKIIITIFRYL